MKVTVKLGDVIVEVDRAKFGDYDSHKTALGGELRNNIMRDSVMPLISEVVNRAKELYIFKNGEDNKANI